MTKTDYLPSFDMVYVSKVMKIKSRRGKFYSLELFDNNKLIIKKGKSYFRMEYDGINEVKTEFNFEYRNEDLSNDEAVVVYAFDETIKTIRKYLTTKMEFIRIKFYMHVVIASLIFILFPIIIGLSSLKNIFFYGFIISLCFRIIDTANSNANRDVSIMEKELDAVKRKYKEMNSNENNNK